MKKTRFYLSVFLLAPLWSYGQEKEPISTDRPDQSDGVYVMPQRAFQLETGLFLNHENHDSITHSSLLRLGVLPFAELRLVIEEAYAHQGEYKVQGLLPVGIASKIALWKQQDYLPAATFSGYLRLPYLASKDFKTPYYAHTGLIALQYKFGEKLVLNQNTGAVNDGTDRSYRCFVTGSATYELVKNLVLMGEYFAYYSPQQLPDHNADAGILYRLNDHVQVDVAYGTSLAPQPHSWYLTAGFSCRIIPHQHHAKKP